MSQTTSGPAVADRGPAPCPSPAGRGSRRDNLMLAVMLGAVFMALLDSTIVNVATPTIRTDLRASGSALQLVVSGYTIAYAALLVAGARLGARHGFRGVFLSGLGVFTAASLACGLAPGSGVLIGARIAQGAGAAMLMPQIYSLIQVRFEGAARARALSLYAAVIGLGVVVGQVAGGLLVSADLFGTGWRPVFLLNVPIGAVLAVAGLLVLPRGRSAQTRGVDAAGLVTLTAALLLLVVPLVLGHERGWPRWTQVSLAAAVPAFAVFAWVERVIARRGGAPLVSGRVLRVPGLVSGAAANFCAMAGYAGFLFVFSQHMQSGLGESATRTGLTFAPLALGVAAGSLTWQRLPVSGRAMIAAAGAVAAAGYLGIGFVMRGGGHGGVALPALHLAVGVGMGFTTGPLLTVALARVAPADAADASGVMTTAAQIAQVLGVAVYGSVYLGSAGDFSGNASAHAVSVTALLVAGGASAGGLAALTLPREARPKG